MRYWFRSASRVNPLCVCHVSKSNCSVRRRVHHVTYIELPESTLECILYGIVSVEIHLYNPIWVH